MRSRLITNRFERETRPVGRDSTAGRGSQRVPGSKLKAKQMADEVASLGFAVDSSQLDTAKQKLADVASQSDKTGQSVDDLNKSLSQTGDAAAKSSTGLGQSRAWRCPRSIPQPAAPASLSARCRRAPQPSTRKPPNLHREALRQEQPSAPSPMPPPPQRGAYAHRRSQQGCGRRTNGA